MTMMITQLQTRCKSTATHASNTLTTNKQNLLAGAPHKIPREAARYRRPEGAEVEPSHACTSIANLQSVNVHSSDDEAHARVLLTCANGRESRQFDSGQQIDEEDQVASADGRVSGSMRRRAAVKAHAMHGGSLPDAAAAAAFSSSAAARRTDTASATGLVEGRAASASQAAVNLRKRLANKHARAPACSLPCSNSSNAAQPHAQRRQLAAQRTCGGARAKAESDAGSNNDAGGAEEAQSQAPARRLVAGSKAARIAVSAAHAVAAFLAKHRAPWQLWRSSGKRRTEPRRSPRDGPGAF